MRLHAWVSRLCPKGLEVGSYPCPHPYPKPRRFGRTCLSYKNFTVRALAEEREVFIASALIQSHISHLRGKFPEH